MSTCGMCSKTLVPEDHFKIRSTKAFWERICDTIKSELPVDKNMLDVCYECMNKIKEISSP